MREAIIVSTARTPIGKAYRGAFNNTTAQAMGAHAIKHAVERAKVDPAEVEDVIMRGDPDGHRVPNEQPVDHSCRPARFGGRPVHRPPVRLHDGDRHGRKQIIADGMDVAIGGGVESISMNQTGGMFVAPDPQILADKPSLYMAMIETAEIVGERYGVSREAQDAYAAQSQARTAAAQQADAFDDEIVPLPSVTRLQNKETGEVNEVEVNLEKDEAPSGTTAEGLSGLQPVFKDGQVIKEGKHVTAGNASQLSDGASACVLMERKLAETRGLEPLGVYRGMAVAGTNPDEMGIGPVFAVPKLLEKNGLTMDDVGLELNEAFAVQVLCRDTLGTGRTAERERGAISIGHLACPVCAGGRAHRR